MQIADIYRGYIGANRIARDKYAYIIVFIYTIMIVKSPSLLVQTHGAPPCFFQGASMFRVNWRPHPAELMRPGVNFGVPVGWGLRWCSDVYPRLRANGSRTSTLVGHCVVGVCVGVPTAFHTRQAWVFFAAGLVCSAELASGVGEMIASL